MRSNSLDFSSFETMVVPGPYKKTERSHEENQERAYIAASRRTDRSLEARVQSARMASDIHKRRTGKSFRITEQVVLNEEMYEEEDDDLPRSYRLLGQSASPGDMNHRVEAYLSNKVAMSTILARTNDEWRQNEVNKRFAQLFPQHANFETQRQASSMSPAAPNSPPQAQSPQQQQQQQQEQQQQQQQQQPFPQRPQPVPQQFQHIHAHSEPFPHTQQFYPQHHASQQHVRAFSTSALGQCPPPHPDFLRQDSGIALPTSPPNFDISQPESPIDLGSSRSAFTSELPPEARMMMMGGMSMSTGFDNALPNWAAPPAQFPMSEIPRASKGEEEQVVSPTDDDFDMHNPKWDPLMDDTTWNAFINDNAWADSQ
ncbi:hypothetical protein V2A60_000261 [Cordyceps javanica]